MHVTREIARGIHWVGSSDRRLERFENMFPLPNGVAYNAWVILDEKTAVVDTVDASIGQQFMENITHVLNGRPLDYLIINHMEPDHCANIDEILRRWPDVQLVGNPKTHVFFKQFYPTPPAYNALEIKEGDTLPLGTHTLRFVMAPMVHWPEVMMTYEESERVLFAADAFGTFGALPGNCSRTRWISRICSSMTRAATMQHCGPVWRPGAGALKKLAGTDIRMICPLHGPMWRKNLSYLLDLYDKWSRYEPEKKGVVLAYGSMYGNTENAVNALAFRLGERGVTDMRMHDVSKSHPSYVISDFWKYSHLVLAAPTYNMGLYLPMHALLHEAACLGLKNRHVTLIGNHTWSSAGLKGLQEYVTGMKDMTVLGEPMDLRSALRPDSGAALDALADAIAASVLEK